MGKNNVKPEYKGNLRRVEEIAEGLEAKAKAIIDEAKDFAYQMVLNNQGNYEFNPENQFRIQSANLQASCLIKTAQELRTLLNRKDKQDAD